MGRWACNHTVWSYWCWLRPLSLLLRQFCLVVTRPTIMKYMVSITGPLRKQQPAHIIGLRTTRRHNQLYNVVLYLLRYWAQEPALPGQRIGNNISLHPGPIALRSIGGGTLRPSFVGQGVTLAARKRCYQSIFILTRLRGKTMLPFGKYYVSFD